MTTSSQPVDLGEEFAEFGLYLERLGKTRRYEATHVPRSADAKLLQLFEQVKPEPEPTKPTPPPGYKLCKGPCGRTLLLASFYRHPLKGARQIRVILHAKRAVKSGSRTLVGR